MYQIKYNSEQKIVEIQNPEFGSFAKIYLCQGANLQELKLNNQELIKDLSPLTYADTYCSSILFPFVNRIKDGKYSFDGQLFEFETNEVALNNALHGLVYNKTFEIIDQQITAEFASVSLLYKEQKIAVGFPYTYTIQLKYTITGRTLELQVEVKNTDSKAFPFTIGWHPYFLSSNLYDSAVQFNCDKKTASDDRNITTGISDIDTIESLPIKDQFLDDCFVLNSNEVTFQTPQYTFKLTASEQDSFLQLYTPPHPNTIAIEPTTGVSDSFNNGIGLKTIQPDGTYTINWKIELI